MVDISDEREREREMEEEFVGNMFNWTADERYGGGVWEEWGEGQ